jgi:DNA/RNA-binding domain of Phe-tRNA-synthetase-like protein
MSGFGYEPDLLARYPRLVGGVIHAAGLSDPPSSSSLSRAFAEEQRVVRERVGTTPLSELQTLAAWRRVFRDFGVDPTQYRSAAEALLRRLVKQGELPTIGTLVDLANLVSIRYALPVAVFDVDSIDGDLRVGFATGAEPWSDLGSSETTHPDPGEVVFLDERGTVHARRWCWRQSARSAAGPATSAVLVTIEGHHEAASADVRAGLADLSALLVRHAEPAIVRAAVLGPEGPTFLSAG